MTNAVRSGLTAAAALFVLATPLGAQQQAAAHHEHGAAPLAIAREQLTTLARAHVAIIAAQDSNNARLAKPGNKTDQAQLELKEKFQAQVAGILQQNGLTVAQYQRGTYLVSSDTATRRVFDSLVVAVTGAPLPGYVIRGPQLPVPAGPAGVHAGHVVNTFDDTPNLGQGLLPTAIAEARIAVQHAGLAGRMPDNLEYMKTHSGHVIHALDPTAIPEMRAPGLGYGVKKATNGVIVHTELAAAAQGAPPAFATHSKPIVIASRNTLVRVDQIIGLAQKVRAATTAPEAAALVSQMAAIAEQLLAGFDANGDGRITWEMGEGGLQHADEHARLMLRP